MYAFLLQVFDATVTANEIKVTESAMNGQSSVKYTSDYHLKSDSNHIYYVKKHTQKDNDLVHT